MELREVIAVDGAAESATLRQALCDALGVPLVWRRSDSAWGVSTVTGAAALAARGVGAEWQATDAMRADDVRHEPSAEAHERLERVFEKRRALYEAVKTLY
jgi:sugar (pentulose or hexulose) kinase